MDEGKMEKDADEPLLIFFSTSFKLPFKASIVATVHPPTARVLAAERARMICP
jgi:hypothetical protein